ncbi:MAG: hypothetical protein K9M45_10280 [Kiritimatiellales bacterium]|nr:hypothetical protein [Kiritimatiellales bacterium]
MNWTFHSGLLNEKTRAYWLFGLVVAVYVGGVIGYSLWSYRQHKNGVLAHTDAQLRNGAMAVEVALGESFLSRADSADAISPEEHRILCGRMNGLATDCRFDALGAAVINSSGTYAVVTGIRSNTRISDDAIPYWKPVRPELLPFIRRAARFQSREPVICPVPYGEDGVFRSAIIYRKTGPKSGYCIFTARNLDYIETALRLQSLRAMAKGLFFLLMAYPLMLLYSTAQQKSSRELAILNAQLRNDVEKRGKHEEELKDAIRDLERFNAVAVGRENRILELKTEVNKLLIELDRPIQYHAVPAELSKPDLNEHG